MQQWLKIERIPGPLASIYAKAARMVIKSYYRQVADEVVSSFSRGLLLDLGTGPGYLPVEIAKRAPEIKIIGVDLSRKLIQMARANAMQAGLSQQISFEVGDAASLRFKDDAFDMVLSTGMLHALIDPVKVLKEIYRVLKTGAEAWIYDPANVTEYIDRRQWKASLTIPERFFLGFFMLLGLHKPIAPYHRSQVVRMLAATDFKVFSIDEKDREIRIKLRK